MCVNKKVSTSSIDRQFNSYVYSTRWKEKWQLNVRIRSSYASTSYGLCKNNGRNVTTDVTCMRVAGRRIINTLAALAGRGGGKRKKKRCWKKKFSIRRIIHRFVIVSYERSPEMSTDKGWSNGYPIRKKKKREQLSVFVHAPMRVKPLIKPDRSPLDKQVCLYPFAVSYMQIT